MEDQETSTARADAVRAKMASLKAKIDTACKRTGTAREALAQTETRARKAAAARSKIQEQITRQEVTLARMEDLIGSLTAKKKVLDQFIADQQRVYPLSPVKENERLLNREIKEFTEQTNNTTRKYWACIDKQRSVEGRLNDANVRIASSEKSIRALEDELGSLKRRMQTLRGSADRRAIVCCLENDLIHMSAKAETSEEREAELEMTIVELEDQVEVYRARIKRISHALTDHARQGRFLHKCTQKQDINQFNTRGHQRAARQTPQWIQKTSGVWIIVEADEWTSSDYFEKW